MTKGFHNISITSLHNEIAGLKVQIVEEREESKRLRNRNRDLRMQIVELQRQIDELHRRETRRGTRHNDQGS